MTTCLCYYNEGACPVCDAPEPRYPLANLERRETQRDIRQVIVIAVVLVLAVLGGTVWQTGKSSASVADPFVHFNDTWTPIPRSVTDVLTESGRPHADTRNWDACAIHWGRTTSRIICPNGYTTRY